MSYTISHIQKIIGGQFLHTDPPDHRIERLLFDSRHLVFPDKTLFFAFQSSRQDGHFFIKELYEKGVRNFIITKTINPDQFPHANLLLVHDAITAIQQLARFHRQQFDIPVIGITGSNGKTIIKEWLFQLLQPDYRIVKSPASYNSQIGVPLSVWQLDKADNLAIFEAGISKVGEMEKIAPIIDCSIGLFTNIGAAHDEGFSSRTQKIAEKTQLFTNSQIIVYCKDHSQIDDFFSSQNAWHNHQFFTWGTHPEADLQISTIRKREHSSQIDFFYQNQSSTLTVPFADNLSIENLLHCCAIMVLKNYAVATIQKRIRWLRPLAMRLEYKQGINNCTIINDSYSADLTSLESGLNIAVRRASGRPIILILSDILQSGLSDQDLYQRVASLILAKGVSRLIAIGSRIPAIRPYLPDKFQCDFYKNTTDFFQKNTLFPATRNAVFLLKGARVFHFEKIAHRLAAKVHKATLEVNMDALIHNLKVYAQYLQPDTKLIAMVKADAYGSGSVEVAKLLEFYKVDYLAVAYADEGVELRKAGIQLPIMVLNPDADSLEVLVQHRLEPEVYSLELLQQLLDFLPVRTRLPIHLKIDTGMHRLGFEEHHLPLLIKKLKNQSAVLVKSIFSHLAASDMPEHDPFTHRQVAIFKEAFEQIAKGLSVRPDRHILNSAGILRFSQYQFEMVRLGIGLYGFDGSGIVQSRLQVVSTLKATISQIKQISTTETVGYNRSGKVKHPTRIATINIGYADGLPRSAGNGNYHLSVNGHRVPVIGDVCMDMCMLDVSDVKGIKIGDEVVIFGQKPSVQELANAIGTIAYEVLTGVSNRVKRIYYRG